MAKKKGLSDKQRTEILDTAKSLGRGIIDIMKSGPVPRYALTSLGLLALGKAKLVSCGVVGTLQGVNTYLAISEVVEEADSSFFGIGGMGETLAKGGTSVMIGALWGAECELGKQKYSQMKEGYDFWGIDLGEPGGSGVTGVGFTKTHDECKDLTGMDYLWCRRESK